MDQKQKPDFDVISVGAGFAGLALVHYLREAGMSIRVFDRASDIGGTWTWNRYPGAMCDVESYVYMPLCEELGYVPTEKYAHQPELLAHSQAIMRHYDLYPSACLGAEVESLTWLEDLSRWRITTTRGDTILARFAIVNFGVFSHPKLPAVPGLSSFHGEMFHTSRWNYDLTGGSTVGGLSGLQGKRVAIIGTGATAVQVVPHLAAHATELYVFQRTPSTIDVRNNFKTTKAYVPFISFFLFSS